MLICNNCSALNEDHAKSCFHCNMIDNFSPQVGDSKSDDTPTVQEVVICQNCGSDHPGHGAKCTHCRFPLPSSRIATSAMQQENTEVEVSTIHLPSKYN